MEGAGKREAAWSVTVCKIDNQNNVKEYFDMFVICVQSIFDEPVSTVARCSEVSFLADLMVIPDVCVS